MTQTVQVRCPGCEKMVRVPPDWVRQPVRCKNCQAVFQLRTKTTPAEAPVFEPALPKDVSVAPRPLGAGAFVPHHQGRRPAYELLFALGAIVAVTALYVFVSRDGVPRASSFVGHVLAVAGFLMMLGTETLYTLRKRLRRFTLWRTSTWLRMHIFTGIVGPYLVLLHSAWRFNGLAGILTLLTIVMVVSGFVGRFIYTAVPRNLDGVEVAVQELKEQIAEAERHLQALGGDRGSLAVAAEAPPDGWMLVLGRPWLRWRQRRRVHDALRNVKPMDVARKAQLKKLLTECYRLQLQVHSLPTTRRLLALWHVFHMPLGAVVFTLAFIHVGGALYYATLLR